MFGDVWIRLFLCIHWLNDKMNGTMKNLLWIAAILLASCAGKKSDEGILTGQPVDLDPSARLVASALFDTIEYVPLETNDTFLVGYIERPKLAGDDICFISDKSFYMFDAETGKGRLKLSRLGMGPGEYQSLSDALVDPVSGDIELLDNNRRQILVYDSAGSYKRSLSLPFMPFGFAKSGAGDYWFYNNNLVSDISRHRLVRYDAEAGRVTGEHFPIDDHVAGYFFVVDDNNFAVSDGSLYYMASPSDTLYRLGEKVSPVYRLGLDKYRVPADFWKANYSDIMEFVTAANSHDYVYSITNFSLNPQAVMVSFMLKDRLYWSFYSVAEGKAYTASSLYDDFHFTESLALSPASMTYVMDDECLYCLMSSDQFLELAENAKSPVIENLIRQYDVTEQSNPILMKCRLKVD